MWPHMKKTDLFNMTEHQIQATFIKWVRVAQKKDERLKLLFAVPNGGNRDIVTATILKREGVIPGVPDIIFPLANKHFSGLAIEFKEPNSGRFSEAQSIYIDLLQKYSGWMFIVCVDAEDAIGIVSRYLKM